MKVIVKGEEIELVKDPRHGVVRELRRERNKMIMHLLTGAKDLLDKGMLKENMSLDEAIEIIGSLKPELLGEFTQMQEDFEILATISLATNRVWKIEDFDDLTETEFWDLYEKCREAIGGTAEDFFVKYETRTSYKKS